jgi:hypothetical protein
VQALFGGEKILNLSRTPHGNHRGVLQEQKSVFDLSFSPSLGQMFLQTQPIFILNNPQAKSLAKTKSITGFNHNLK